MTQIYAPESGQHFREQMEKYNSGASMRKLQTKQQSALLAMALSGQLRSATILNFNPIALVVNDFKVANLGSIPSCGIYGGSLKRQVVRLPIDQDRTATYDASYVTFRGSERLEDGKLDAGDIIIDYWPTQVKANPEDPQIIDREFNVKPRTPTAIVYQYFYDYNGARNGQNTGGVVIFVGDIQTIRDQNVSVAIPNRIQLPDRSFDYELKERPFLEVVREQMQKQREYCDFLWTTIQKMWDDDLERSSITAPHRLWGRYMCDMGWRKPAPWMYVTDGDAEQCRTCGAARRALGPGQYAALCVCGKPFDPFQAFMEGQISIENVALDRCSDEQWVLIREEQKRRAARRAGIDSEPTEDSEARKGRKKE